MRAILSLEILILAVMTAGADLRSDILGLTGSRAKVVWSRFTWANDNYTPKPRVSDPFASTSLVLFDTDEGVERVIDPALGQHQWIRITRSGKWVIWNAQAAKRSYIADLTGAQPNKRVLIDNASNSAWFVGAVGADQATGREYLYCLDGFNANVHGTDIYKIPLSSNGAADVNNRVRIPESSSGNFDNTFSVSSDGKKIGCAHPWPDTYILDTETGRFDGRHGNAIFGCHACLAPDNSYRFYHFNDEHDHLWLFGPNMSTTSTSVALNISGLPFNTWPSGEESPSHMGPRWSNHVQFFTGSYPLEIQNALSEDGRSDFGDIYALSASQVQNSLRMDILGITYLGKFNAGFTAVEKYVCVAADKRQFNWHGDTWTANGITDGQATDARANARVHNLQPASWTSRVVDLQGRRRSLPGATALSSGPHFTGAGVVLVQDARGASLRPLVAR